MGVPFARRCSVEYRAGPKEARPGGCLVHAYIVGRGVDRLRTGLRIVMARRWQYQALDRSQGWLDGSTSPFHGCIVAACTFWMSNIEHRSWLLASVTHSIPLSLFNFRAPIFISGPSIQPAADVERLKFGQSALWP